MIHAHALLHLREDGGAALAHLAGVALHDAQVGADGLGEVGLVDDEEVALGDAGAALAGDLVAAADVDDVDDEVGQLAAVVGGEVVAAGLDEEQVRGELGVQVLEGGEVGGDVLAHGGVRAAAGLDGADPRRREGLVPRQELGVLAREDVVGHGCQAVLVAERQAEGQHQGRLARADGAVGLLAFEWHTGWIHFVCFVISSSSRELFYLSHIGIGIYVKVVMVI